MEDSFFGCVLGIGLERNNRIFEAGIEESVLVVWDKIKFWVAIWPSDVKEFKGCLFSDLVRGGVSFCNLVDFLLTCSFLYAFLVFK